MGGIVFVGQPEMDIEAAEIHMVPASRVTYFPTNRMPTPTNSPCTSTPTPLLKEYDLD